MGRCKLLSYNSPFIRFLIKHWLIFNKLPWSTHEDEPWPRRKKYKKRRALPLEAESVTLQTTSADQVATATEQHDSVADAPDDSSHTEETMSTVNVATDTLTTNTPEPTKQQSTPSLPKSPSIAKTASPVKVAPRPAVPAVPVVPALPKNGAVDINRTETNTNERSVQVGVETDVPPEVSEEPQEVTSAPKPSYRNWADILKPTTTTKPATIAKPGANGNTANEGTEIMSEQPSTLAVAKSGTVALAEVLKSYRVGGADKTGEKLVFIEPRGLHNSGVDCFMNSVSLVPIQATSGPLTKPMSRSSKFSSSVTPFMLSSVKLRQGQLSASGTTRLYLRPCK